jgi:FolB domain-containing protein
MDRILIRDLSARCIIGINDEERREKQDVLINLTIFADLRQAGLTDKFEESVDFRALKKRILELVEKSSYHLIEALAEAIASLCLEDKGIMQVKVRVDKPCALRFAKSVGVEITRKRQA